MCVVSLGPFRGVVEDAALPTLSAALQPAIAGPALVHRLGALLPASATLTAITVKAYKPGRRCLIEYELSSPSAGAGGTVTVLGKIRANRFGNSGDRQLRTLWNAGFDGRSRDGISVPEPLGTVPSLRMWLQRKVPGTTATHLLCGAGAAALVERIACAVHKLHTAGVAAGKRHTVDDELTILSRCLAEVAKLHPDLAPRLSRLIDGCARVGGLLTSPQWCSSHRDFYADQVLVTPDRLYLIDFDLFCEADRGLDLGNFLGHVSELGLRLCGDAGALRDVERRLEDAFVALAGESVRPSVRAYAALTVARHVFLSTRLAGRSRLTGALLGVAEQRLRLAAAEGGHA